MKWLVKHQIPNLEPDEPYNYEFIMEMNKYKGKVIEMTLSPKKDWYEFKNINSTYFFHKSWLETPYVRVKASICSGLYGQLVGRKLTISREEEGNGIIHFEETSLTCSRYYLEPWIDGEKWDSVKWIKEEKNVYLVVKSECGVYKPSVNPITHLTEESALNEAKRLSKNSYHGQSFSVFKEIHVEKVVKPKYEVGTQLKAGKKPLEFHTGSIITIIGVGSDYYTLIGYFLDPDVTKSSCKIQTLEEMNLEVVFRPKDEIPF